ncbi:MAG: acyl-CoA dehydrogenase family protein [Acidimicrobiia bacterium]
MMFTPEHDAFRSMLASFVEREINPRVEEWEAAGDFDAHDVFAKLGALGALGLEYDPAYGGQGADHLYTLILGEELGRIHCGGVPMAIGVQTDMATPALHRYGSHELKRRYLAPALRGEMVAAIGVTEPDAGSDVASIRTKAVRDGDMWIINGAKLYITNGIQADWVCLLVRTSDEGGYRGMSQILVPTDSPGFSVSRRLHKLGNWSSDTAELHFDDMRVPVANTIGEVGRGFQQQMTQFQNERLIAAYQATTSISSALERTREYMKQRVAFGAPLAANQHIAFRLAELSAESDMYRTYCYAAAQAVVRGEDVTRMATIAKLKGGRLLREVADTCIQFYGGVGYMEETWTARYLRDSRLMSIGGGADEVMLRVLSMLDGLPG